jgi:hypothetical protein
MDQRQPRLGDIIDDYCPRERRLSNHVIVALVGDDVKQTRCTTCDADHPYKGARVPPRRKKQEAPAALYQQVLNGVQDQAPAPAPAPALEAEAPVPTPPVGAVLKPAAPRRPAHGQRAAAAAPREEPASLTATATEPAAAAAAPARADDEGPVHRPLIRATLPRPEGQVQTRQPPDFTLRLPGARLGPFRDGNAPGEGQHPRGRQKPPRPHGKHAQAPGAHRGGRPGPNGNRSGFGGHGSGQGQPPFGPRRPRPRHGGGKKRSR